MPELPEVELVARSLDRFVNGRTITDAHLLRARLAPDSSPKQFSRLLRGARINFIHRRGKHILFDLANGRTLLAHLRMSGKFRLLPAEAEHPKFTHAILELDDGRKLVFQDQRHFGLMKVMKTSDAGSVKEIAKLAPEPFSDEFSAAYLRTVLTTSRRPLKEFLLDQSKVCGLGNIYASEAMFLAGVSPRMRASRLSKARSAALHASILRVFGDAFELMEQVEIHPEDIGGSIYGNGTDTEWRVYDREGEPCTGCGASIVRLKQAGRSTYYCRNCQRS